MKIWAGLCVAALGVVGGCSADSGVPVAKRGQEKMVEVPINPPPSTTHAALTGTTATLIVHGLACPSCAHGVLRELKRLEGVTDAELDTIHGEAMIEFKEGQAPTWEQVRQAVSWGGGVLVDIEQP